MRKQTEAFIQAAAEFHAVKRYEGGNPQFPPS